MLNRSASVRENASFEGQNQRQPVKIKEFEKSLENLQKALETVWTLNGGIEIPEGADLESETYKIPGNYYCRMNATVPTLLNCPVNAAFTMKVYCSIGAGTLYIIQEYILYNTGARVTKMWNGYSGKWEGTYKHLMDTNVQSGRTAEITCAAGKITDYEVTFPKTFSSVPNVSATIYSGTTSAKYGNLTVIVASITTKGFKARLANNSDITLSPVVSWVAAT